MQERQQMDNGEATAGALLGRLPKRVLQRRGIRHRAARAVDKKRAMAMPAAFRRDDGLGRLPQALQQVFQHADGELGTSLTVCRGTEIEASQMGQMATRRIAMKDLEQKQLDGDDGMQETVTPRRIADGLTGGRDRLGLQLGRPISFEALEDRGDPEDQRNSPQQA